MAAGIQVSFDVAKAQAESQQFADLIRQSGQVTGDFTAKVTELNEQGKAASQTIQQLNAAGQTLNLTFERSGNTVAFAGAKIVETAKSAKAALDQLNSIAGKGAGDTARQLFPLPDTASISKVQQYTSAVQKLQQIAGSGGVSGTNVTALFNQLQATNVQQFAAYLQTLPPALQAVGNQLLTVAGIAQAAGAAGANAGKSFAISWQGLARIVEVQLFRRAVTSVVNAVRDGISSAMEYQISLQQVANVTDQTGARFEGFRNRVRQLSEEFAIPSVDVLRNAQVALTSQLGDSARGFEVLTSAMRLSQATGTDLGAATRLVTTSLQAFHLGSEDAGRAANVLYVAAQRSRIPLDELQNAIGRVSQTSGGLGISLEQTVALFSTIAQQGGRPTEAFSLLNQVLGRLLQPTKELQNYLNSLGTPTAALAIRTFGLTGFLQRLNETAANSPARLGDLAGSVRTLRGLMALTGEQAQVFETNLRALGSNSTSLLEASTRVSLTPAQQIRAEFEKLKNVFTQDIGTSAITTFVNLTNALGGPKTAVTGLVNALKTLVDIWIAYKVATTLIPALNAASSLSFSQMGTAIRSSATSLNALTAIFTITYAASSLYFTSQQVRAAQLRDQLAQLVTFEQRNTEERNERIRAAGRAETEAFKAQLAERVRPALADSARRVQIASDEKDRLSQFHRQVTDEFRTQSATFLDTLKERLSRTRAEIRQAEQDIKTSRRSVEQFEQATQQRGFQNRLGNEQVPERAIAMAQGRINNLRTEANRILNDPQATEEMTARARRMYDEIGQLQDEVGRRELDAQRSVAERTNNYRDVISNGQIVRVIELNYTTILDRQNALIRERAANEEAYQRNRQAALVAAQAAAVTEQTRVRTFEALVREAERFKVVNESGQLTPVFRQAQERNPNGARQEAEREYDAIVARIRAASTPAEYAALAPILAQRRAALLAELAAVENLNRAQSQQEQTVRRIAELESNMLRLREQRTTAVTNASSSVGQAGTFIEQIRRQLGPQLNLADLAQTPATQNAARAYNDIRDATNAASEAQRRFVAQGGQTAENAAALQRTFDRLSAAIRTFNSLPGEATNPLGDLYRSITGGGAVNNNIQTFLQGLTTQSGTLQQLEQIGRRTNDAFNSATGSVREVETAMSRLNSVIDRDTTPFRRTANDIGAMGTAAQSTLPVITSQFIDAATAAERLERATATIATRLRLFDRINGTVDPNFVGPPEQRWAGGYIGPRGTDTIPAWLSPGEFVMNAGSTRRFYTQLLSMNAGVQPRYFSGGGPVSVGDIHLTLNGGETSEKSIREIGRGLDREIKRGTIRLGRRN